MDESSTNGPEPGVGRSGRMSRQRKRDAVLRLLRGEDLELVSRSLGVTASRLSEWRDEFLSAGESALATREKDNRDLEIERLRAKLGEVLLAKEPLESKIDVMESGRASVYRYRAAPVPPRRRGPTGPLSDIDLVDEIRAVLTASPFHGEGYRKVWVRLRFKGIRTTQRRVMRLMREHDRPPGPWGRPRGPRTHDEIIRTKRVNEMWGTDLTATWTGEGQVSVMTAVDHCSAECVGIHASKRATRFEALEPIR